MATFIATIKFTEQGIQNIHESPKRAIRIAHFRYLRHKPCCRLKIRPLLSLNVTPTAL